MTLFPQKKKKKNHTGREKERWRGNLEITRDLLRHIEITAMYMPYLDPASMRWGNLNTPCEQYERTAANLFRCDNAIVVVHFIYS